MAESTRFEQIGFAWQILDEDSRQHAVAECLKRISGHREGPQTESDEQVAFGRDGWTDSLAMGLQGGMMVKISLNSSIKVI